MNLMLKTVAISLCSLYASYKACEQIDEFAQEKTTNSVLKICTVQSIALFSFAITKKVV